MTRYNKTKRRAARARKPYVPRTQRISRGRLHAAPWWTDPVVQRHLQESKGGQQMSIGRRSGAFIRSFFKFDAKVGTCTITTRAQDSAGVWSSKKRELNSVRAVFDLANVWTGWLAFPEGAAPDLRLARLGEERPPRPSDKFREGLRVLLVLDGETEPSEFLSTAGVVWDSIDLLHTDYEAGVADHPGELPIVELDDVIEEETSQGTVYKPIFVIVGWRPRPACLPIRGIPPAPAEPRKPPANDSIPF
jgi:hypothetical protein